MFSAVRNRIEKEVRDGRASSACSGILKAKERTFKFGVIVHGRKLLVWSNRMFEAYAI